MNAIKNFIILSVIFLFVVAFNIIKAEADCISCVANPGSVLACEGDSRFDVIAKCGNPDYVEEGEETKIGEIGPRILGEKSKSFTMITEKVERLYYNCGDGKFIKIVIVRGGKIVAVQDGDRGSGNEKCW